MMVKAVKYSVAVAVLVLVGCGQKDAQTETTQPPVQPAFVSVDAASVAGTARAPCSIDKISGRLARGRTVTLKAGTDAVFNGWVADPAKQVPAEFNVVLSGATTYSAVASAGQPRPDVARSLRADTLQNAGFNSRLTLAGVAPGEYAVSLVHRAGDKVVRCDTKTLLTVEN
ncbi:MAG TPA: hypothetical protein VJ484_08170 [Lysobacter sp.]|nr:hypothetical protein [Lysobacter sp.]